MSVKQHIRNLAGESLVYGLSGIITRFISVFLFPLFTRALTPHDYGSISMLNSIYFVVNIITILGLDSATFRWYYNTDNEHQRRQSLATWFVTELGMSMMFAMVCFAFNDSLELFFLNEVSGHHYFFFMGSSLVLNVIPSLAANYFRIRRKPVSSVSYSLFTSVVNITANIILVIYLKQGVKGILLAQVISTTAGSIAGLLSFGKWLIPSNANFDLLKQMLKYGIPLMPAGLSATVTVLITNFLIQKYTSTAEVGFYQVATTISSGLALFTAAFAQAWSPFSLSIMEHKDSDSIYTMAFRLYFIIYTSLALLLSLFAREVILVLATPVYLPSAFITGILTFSSFFGSLTVIAFTGLSIKKRTSGYALVSVIGSFTTVLVLFFTVPIFGKTGAALCIMLSQLIVPVYLFYSSHKVHPIAFSFRFGILIVAVSFIIFLIGTEVEFQSELLTIGFKSALVIIFLITLSITNKGLAARFYGAIKRALNY